MTEQLPIHDDYSNGFRGKHVAIQLTDTETLSKLLESHDRSQTILDIKNEDNLPYPARFVKLESWHEEKLATPRIEGEVCFRPTSLESAPGSWPQDFLHTLAEAIQSSGYDTTLLTHDVNAFYVSLDITHSIRIALTSTSTDCAIDFDLEVTSEIENATHESLAEPHEDRELNLLEKLHHIVKILGLSLDNLRDFYGKPPKEYKQYVLKQFKPSKELVVTQQTSGQPHQSEFEGVSFDTENEGIESVGGATHAKQRLEELAAIMNQPDEAAKFDIKRNHFLLYGPPGTGKTTLVTAFSREIGATLLPVSSADLVDKYVGESGKQVKQLFDRARAASGNIVLFFDEFDALAQKAGNGAGERTDVKKVLNVQLEDIAKNHPNIIVAAATNADLDDLEPSLIRSGRIESIGVPAPNEDERFDIFGLILFKSIQRASRDSELQFEEDATHQQTNLFSLYDLDLDLREIARLADGMTGADFEVILERARKKHFMHFRKTSEYRSVSQQDLLREIREFGR